jgi:spore coat protein CotH
MTMILAAGMAVATGAAWPAARATAVDASTAPTVSIFDSSRVHDISVTFDEADYDSMIQAFRDTDEKEWIEATVSIDGATYEQAGMRLKGNSSLMGLSGRGPGGRTFPGAPAASAAPGVGTGVTTGEAPGRGPGGFAGRQSASADEPESLPWLIRLDKYVDGQAHQGYLDLVIRSNNSDTSLNEAVALELLEAAGLASQQASATRFTVNGSEPVLRLTIEHPDDNWQDAVFGDAGALYKAESTGDFSFRGDDPEAYAGIFDQEAGKDVTDLAPLIDFLRFINESDDATFAAELPTRLDVDSFAAYLAMMEMVDNFDDLDGPGNNGYLRYDAATKQFTVVPWDMNLAFGGLGGGFPGGRPPAGFEPPDGFEPPAGFPRPDASGAPEGFVPPEGFDPSRMSRMNRNNPLVERFHANAAFEARYQEQLVALRASLYDTGVAQGILDTWVEVLSTQATDLVDTETIDAEAATISGRFTAE